jgi:hypothetical protein
LWGVIVPPPCLADAPAQNQMLLVPEACAPVVFAALAPWAEATPADAAVISRAATRLTANFFTGSLFRVHIDEHEWHVGPIMLTSFHEEVDRVAVASSRLSG